MSHMVIFRTPEGKPGYQPAETVEDAVEVVERLRNDEGVENVRIFRLEELTFEYRPYYKVEIAGGASGDSSHHEPPAGEINDGGYQFAPEQPAPEQADQFGSDSMAADHDSIETSGDDVPPPPVAEHPPWAAPPPPPPPPASEHAEGESGGHDAGHDPLDDGDDEFTGAGGQRRGGLFGR